MAAIVEQTPLRHAAARAGGVAPLCRELGVTRQTFYLWEQEGGATPVFAILIARLTGATPYGVCRERDHATLDRIADYYARDAHNDV